MPRIQAKYGQPGIYNVTPPTLTDMQASALAVNVNGQLIAAAPSGTSSNQVQGTAASGAAKVGNPIQNGAIFNTVQPTVTTGQIVENQATARGAMIVATGADAFSVQQGNPSNFTLTSAATTNATSVKASAGNLHGLSITNYSAAAKFVKLYDKASAPTVGTDVPTDTLEVAANASRALSWGTLGLRFVTGIAFAITGLQADSDLTATAAGDVKVHGAYI